MGSGFMYVNILIRQPSRKYLISLLSVDVRDDVDIVDMSVSESIFLFVEVFILQKYKKFTKHENIFKVFSKFFYYHPPSLFVAQCNMRRAAFQLDHPDTPLVHHGSDDLTGI